jgi:hypothetical protein
MEVAGRCLVIPDIREGTVIGADGLGDDVADVKVLKLSTLLRNPAAVIDPTANDDAQL